MRLLEGFAAIVRAVHNAQENPTNAGDGGCDHGNRMYFDPQPAFMFHHSRCEHTTEREDGPDTHATAVSVPQSLIWVAERAFRGHEADQHDHQLHDTQTTTNQSNERMLRKSIHKRFAREKR